jgi:ketosteroid isomerase-like protein
MKILLLLLAFTPALAQKADTAVIVDLQKRYDQAVEKKDSAALRKLFHRDMMITGGDGTRRDANAEIRDCVDPRYTVNYFRTNNISVDMFGETAVLRGDLEWQLQGSQGPRTLQRRITYTYARIKGQWVIVSQHIGMMPK